MFVYVGSTTGDPKEQPGAGISVLDMDAAGRFQLKQSVTGLASPTYLAMHPKMPVLYAGERHWPPMGPQAPGTGAITSLAIDPGNGTLTPLATQACGAPAHISVHPNGRHVFAAMNRTQEVAVFPVEADGRVGPPTAVMHHEGRGPKSPNQDRAFPHSTWLDRTNTRLFVCDLGIDRVVVYDFDDAVGTLAAAERPFAQISTGAGPRHLSVHPNNRVLYVLNELDSTISVFGYDADSCKLAILQTASMLPDSWTGQSAAAQIIVHPNGRFVYASNRGHDSIVIFAIDQDTGRLQLVSHEPSQGERPHNFNLDPSGQLMVVANQRSGSVASFRIEDEGARLAPTGHSQPVPAPVCVVLRPSPASLPSPAAGEG